MSQAQIITIQNEIAQKKVGENRELIPGKIAYDFRDGYYNIDADKTDQEGNSVPLVKIPPAPSQIITKYNVGDSVTVLRYQGKDCQTEILGLSNVTYPDETICNFSTVPVATGTIYLGCPDNGLIKVYSLNGAPGTDISPEVADAYNICTDNTYLYYSSNYAYRVFKIKLDGSNYAEIVSQSRYHSSYGIAINSDSTYIYIAYDKYGEELGIAKINISTGEVEETEITDVSFDEIGDLCGDGVYLYLLGRNMCGTSRVAVYDFNVNFIREMYTDGVYNKIATDGTNIYLSNSSEVDIYTVSGTFITSISGSGIQAVTVKDGKIYIVAEESGGGAT